MGSKFLRFGRLVVLVTALAGCTGGEHIVDVKNPSLPDPLVERLPLTVGVYYDRELRGYEHEQDMGYYAGSYVLKLGPASVAMFNDILPKMFKEVVAVGAIPPSPSTRRKILGILAPRIEYVYAQIAGDSLSAQIEFVVMLYSPAGVKLGELGLSSSSFAAANEYLPIEYPGQLPIGAVLPAIAAEFIVSFAEHPDIKKWIERSVASASKNGGGKK